MCTGAMRDPRDGTYSIAIQVWGGHADTLFCAMDTFLGNCDASMCERRDIR